MEHQQSRGVVASAALDRDRWGVVRAHPARHVPGRPGRTGLSREEWTSSAYLPTPGLRQHPVRSVSTTASSCPTRCCCAEVRPSRPRARPCVLPELLSLGRPLAPDRAPSGRQTPLPSSPGSQHLAPDPRLPSTGIVCRATRSPPRGTTRWRRCHRWSTPVRLGQTSGCSGRGRRVTPVDIRSTPVTRRTS